MPTLKEQGIDVSLVNWRGVFAPPQIRDKDKKALEDAIAKMVESPAWKDTLDQARLARPLSAGRRVRRLPHRGPAKVETTLKDVGLVQ